MQDSIAYALFDTWRHNYENGKLKSPLKREINDMTEQNASDTVIEFFRYTFDYLGIKPTELSAEMSEQKLEKLKLKSIFLTLKFPVEYSSKTFSFINKIDYLSRLAYPEYFSEYECSEQYIWMTEYMRCKTAREQHTKCKITLAEDREYNCRKIEYLFNYYWQHNPVPGTDNDLKKCYDFFATKKGESYISKALLKKEMEVLFESPLELFHLSLPECQRSEFLYQYELFKMNQTA